MTSSPQITSKVPGIIWEPITHNFGSRSQGIFSIHGICLHETGAHGDPQAWFNDLTAQASATYCVMQTGAIKQYVPESARAWACGVAPALLVPGYNGPNKPAWPFLVPYRDPNDYLLSIESEKLDGDPWVSPELASLTDLMADIGFRYDFTIDRAHVVGHHDIWSGHVCPGLQCPFDAILTAASAKLAAIKLSGSGQTT